MHKLRNDIILIVSILLIGLIILIIWLCNKTQGNYAYVYKNDTLIQEIDLSKNSEYKFTGEICEITVVVENNTIKITENNCPEKICINTGSVQYENETITCLPNKFFIKIVKK